MEFVRCYIVYWNSICCVIMSREVTVTTPPSRSPRAWNGEGEVLGVVPLLGAQGRKEESKVSLVAPEDVGPAETEAVILARPPDEPSLSTLPEALTAAA